MSVRGGMRWEDVKNSSTQGNSEPESRIYLRSETSEPFEYRLPLRGKVCRPKLPTVIAVLNNTGMLSSAEAPLGALDLLLYLGHCR
jgi:hypothetical protein